MNRIIGNTTATPNPRPDWNQTDEMKADYIKNKPDLTAGLKYYGDAGVIPSPAEWFTYELIEGFAVISGPSDTWLNLSDESKNFVIVPYEIDGHEVNKIGDMAFDAPMKGFNPHTVVLPNTITSIGDFAFAYASDLLEVKIPDSVVEFGEYILSYSYNTSIVCSQGSYAEQYAKENEYKYVYDISNPLTIDNTLDTESTNPVQNKVIALKLNQLGDDSGMLHTRLIEHANTIDTLRAHIDELYGAVASRVMMFDLDEDGQTVVIVYGDASSEKSAELASPQYVDNAIQELITNMPGVEIDVVSNVSLVDGTLIVTKNDGSTTELTLPSGDGSNITVDDALSDTSTNPVQNKVVAEALENYTTKDMVASTLGNYANKTYVDNAIANLELSGGVGNFDELFDYEYSPNLLDLENISVGNVLKADTGTLISNTNYNTTDFIPCKVGDILRLQFTYQATRYDAETRSNLALMRYVAAYDENKNFIVGSCLSYPTTYTAPEGAAYVRVSYEATKWETNGYKDVAFLISDVPLVVPFSEYGTILGKHIKADSELSFTSVNPIQNKAVTEAFEELLDYEYSPNLLDLNSLNIGKYLSSSGSSLSSNTSYNTTDYIPCKSGDVIRLQYKYQSIRRDSETHVTSNGSHVAAIYGVAAYDENKNFIDGSRSGSNVTSYTAPEGAAYVRVSYQVSKWTTGGVSEAAIVICDNPVIFPFSEYGTIVRKSIKTEYRPNSVVKAFLPKEICVAVGRTIELYNNQVCINAERHHIKWDCEIGLALDRKFSITGTTELIGEYLLVMYITDDDLNTVWFDSTIVKVVPATTKEFSICCIGDSLSNGKVWLNELKTLNENISFVGTLGTSPYYHEGRSGFRASDYLSTATSVTPFWNATDKRFDWNYYVTNSLDGVSPDAVQIFLGTNGITIDPTSNASNIKQMIDYIRQDDANIPIFIVNTLYRSNQNGIGRQINTDGFNGSKKGTYKYEEDVKVLNLMIELDRILDGYENVNFVPIATCHDSANNFGKVEVAINPRATDIEYMPVEGTHPQNQGYLQMADIMFSVLSAYMT